MVTVMTDLVGGHQGWLSPRPDAILTATDEASDWCLRHGLPADLIRQTGLPVDPTLDRSALSEVDRRELRRSLGLDPDTKTVLLGGGAEGVGNLKRLVSWMGKSRLPVQVVVACGNNRRLLAWLKRHPQQVKLIALGYRTSLTPWLRAADIYLGKAGPSTMAEAAAAGLALLVTRSLPGQEENNEAALVAAGAALQVHGRQEMLGIVDRLCHDTDPLLSTLQEGALAWSRPRAALEAAQIVLTFLQGDHSVSRLRERSAAG
jgi:UDP-N-acetylglucosamine:LPS N-acetylglucosamine transferase